MPPRNHELSVTFLVERHRFNNSDGDVIVGTARNCESDGEFTIKGPAYGDDPQPRRAYRLYGHWSTYTNKRTGESEKQFHFSSFVKATPLTREAVIDYLTREGAGLNFGSGMARTLWEAFEGETCRVVRKEPTTALAELKKRNARCRVSESQMAALSDRLQKLAHIEQATIETTQLLAGRGFPKITPTHAIREWGNAAPELIRRNPYLLMTFRGCGFRLTDKLYLELGHPPGRLKRQALCAWHAVATESDGSTWVSAEVAAKGIQRNVGGADLKLTEALKLAIRGGLVGRARTRGASGPLVPEGLLDSPEAKEGTRLWIAEGKKARNELRLAELVAEGLGEECYWGVEIEEAAHA